MKTKGEHVNAAMRKLRISGITSSVTGDELSDALEELEGMMNEISGSIPTGWQFEELPDASTLSGVASMFNDAVAWNLALRLTDAYGKQPTMNMTKRANVGLQLWKRKNNRTQQIGQPSTMPVGSGNKRYSQMRNNYFHTEKVDVNNETQFAVVNDEQSIIVDFSDVFLNGEEITNYSINLPTSAVEVDSQIQNQTEIYALIKFTKAGYYTVCFDIVDSNGIPRNKRVLFSVEDGC